MSKFTIQQYEQAMAAISDKARVASTVCIEAVNNGHPGDLNVMADLVVAARAIVEQIGWIADRHCDSASVQKGEAENWLLSPAYHEAGK